MMINMKIISFAWTKEKIRSGKKYETRRKWKDSYAKRFKRGNIVAAYDKQPYFGGNFIRLIRLTKEVYRQKLKDMTKENLRREGGLWTKNEFIDLFGGDPEFAPWVVEFKYVDK